MNYRKKTPIRISIALLWIILQINPLHAEKISENKNSIAEDNPNSFLQTDSAASLQEDELLPYLANKETNERYHSFAIRAGVGSWTEKAAGNSITKDGKLFLRADYEYMFDGNTQLGIDLFYTYSRNKSEAYLLNPYSNRLFPEFKKVNCTYHLHYLGPQLIFKPTTGFFSLKMGAGAGGAMLTMDIPGENDTKYGWMYSLELGMEFALNRHLSLVVDYYFMKSFFEYKGYQIIPDGTVKYQQHTGLLGMSYYF